MCEVWHLFTTSRESTSFCWLGLRRSYAPTVLAKRVSPPFVGFCSMYRDTHSGGICAATKVPSNANAICKLSAVYIFLTALTLKNITQPTGDVPQVRSRQYMNTPVCCKSSKFCTIVQRGVQIYAECSYRAAFGEEWDLILCKVHVPEGFEGDAGLLILGREVELLRGHPKMVIQLQAAELDLRAANTA